MDDYFNKNVLIKKIEDFIRNKGGQYSAFYVGITDDPKRRLEEHEVTSEPSIAHQGDSHEAVREAEEYFLEKGTKGGEGGGDKNSDFIYAYKISPSTDEEA